MNINRIAQVCKKSNIIVECQEDRDDGVARQWLGDYMAMYPVFNMPILAEESIYECFGIPQEKRKGFHFVGGAKINNAICFDDMTADEEIATEMSLSLVADGELLTPLRSNFGVHLVKTRYVQPLKKEWDQISYYIRQMIAGGCYVAVKSGFVVVGLIMPQVIKTDTVIEDLGLLARVTATERQRNEEREESEAALFDNGAHSGTA